MKKIREKNIQLFKLKAGITEFFNKFPRISLKKESTKQEIGLAFSRFPSILVKDQLFLVSNEIIFREILQM